MCANERTYNLLVPDPSESSWCMKLFATVPNCPTTPSSYTGGKKGEGVRVCCSYVWLGLNQVLTELGSYRWLPDSVPQPSLSKTAQESVWCDSTHKPKRFGIKTLLVAHISKMALGE